MIIEGNNEKEKIVDWNKHFKETLVGELDEETARSTLGKYLMYNIGMCVYFLTGFILEPYQRIMIKGWMQKNFSLCIASRSLGKSFLGAHFCYLYCLFNREKHIIIVSATFRSSRRFVELIEAWSKKKKKEESPYPAGEMLAETIDKIIHKPDMWKIIFTNGSTITCLPLGDADNLRGFRCNVLITDETLLIPQNVIELVLKPFLMGGADVTKKQRIRSKEDRDIAAGRMAKNARLIFKSDSKMINLSSASYRWEELYGMYKKYLKIISPIEGDDSKGDQTDNGVSSYLVQQLSYEVAREELLDPAVLKEIKEKTIPESVINREYKAQFIDESGGFFSAKEMKACTVDAGQLPTVEIVGDKNYEYVVGLDPSVSSDPAGDHFAICVLKIIQRPKDGRKICLVVHQYGCCGCELKHHIAYLYYVLNRFNVKYIVCDSTQGKNADFINICNESEYFKVRKYHLTPINADFTNSQFDEIVKQVQREYNGDNTVNQIVQQQYFSSSVIKAGNDYLRACLDQKLILFPSHALSIPNLVSSMCQQDVLGIHETHPEFADISDTDSQEGTGNMFEFVSYQDNMIELVKKECALIEAMPTPNGGLRFDLPAAMSRNRKNEKRNRKDNYSALWLAMWGAKIYMATKETEYEEEEDLGLPAIF